MEDFNIKWKTIFFCLIFCLLISINAINATDINNTDQVGITQSDTISIESDNNNSATILKNSNADKLSEEEASAGTLNDLNTLIRTSNGTLDLDGNYTYNSSKDKSAIDISKSIIIDGHGYTLNSKSFLFKISADNVVLKNIKFTGFTSGTIINLVGNNFTMDNLTFHDCKPETYLYAESCSNLHVKNCTYYNITTRGDHGAHALLGVSGEIKFEDITVNNVAHTSYGGFVRIQYDCSPLIMNRWNVTHFRGTANTWNSLIYTQRNNIKVSYSNFTDIKADSVCTGTVFGNVNSLDIDHCNFKNASGATHDRTTPDTCFYSRLLNVSYCNFTDCSYVRATSYGFFDHLNFTGGNGIQTNQASGSQINNCNFTNIINPIVVDDSDYVKINNCILDNCSGDAPVKITGRDELRTSISNSKITNNTGKDAGAVYITGKLNIDDYTRNHLSGNTLNTGDANDFNTKVVPWISKDIIYVSPNGGGSGNSSTDTLTLDEALSDIDAYGNIYLTQGTYNFTGQKYLRANIEAYDNHVVIINNGSFIVDVPKLTIQKIIFNNTQSNIQILPSITINNCTFNNSKSVAIASKFTMDYAFGDNVCTNLVFTNADTDMLVEVNERGLYENISFTDCNLSIAPFFNAYLGNVPKLININVTQSTMTYFKYARISGSGWGFTSQYNGYSFKNVNISNNIISGFLFNYATNCIADGFYVQNNMFTRNTTTNYLIEDTGKSSWSNVIIENVHSDYYTYILDINNPSISDSKFNDISISDRIFNDVTTRLFVLDNVNFTNINAKHAINAKSDSILVGVHFEDCNFTDYAITLKDYSSLSSSSFDNVTGSVLLNGENIVLDTVKFINCNNLLSGCVVVNGELCFIQDCNFTGNNATGNGSAINIKANGTNIINTDFKNNIVTNTSNNGGAVFVMAGVYYNIDNPSLKNISNILRMNDLYDTGSIPSFDIVYVNSAYTNEQMAANKSLQNDFKMAFGVVKATGTIVFTNASDKVFIIPAGNTFAKQGVTIIGNNTHANIAGFITISKYAYSLTISNVIFSGATNHVFRWIGVDGKLINCTFTNNGGDSASYGSCIDVEGDNLEIINSTFENNTVRSNDQIGGGALYVNSTGLKIINTTFNNNKADHGSHLFLTENSEKITIFNTTFNLGSHSTNAGVGSAIEVNSNYDVVITASKFTNNQASMGGALLIQSSGIGGIVIENTTFDSNKAETTNGGAINIVSGKTTIDNCTFKSNTAVNDGGAVYNNVAGLIVSDSNFTANTANHDGGALYSNVNVGITGSNFTSNRANGNGGAVYLNGKSNHLSNLKFTNNTAVNGSAVYLADNGGVEFRNVLVKDNVHTGADSMDAGGDVYIGDDAIFTIPNDDLQLEDGQTIRLGSFTSPVIYVNSDSPGEFGTGTYNDPVGSIAEGIAHVENGGRIILLSDTELTQMITIMGKTFTLVGNASTVKRDENNKDKSLFNNSLTHIKSCS